MSSNAQRLKATQLLILATAFWGLSFPTVKALAMAQETMRVERVTRILRMLRLWMKYLFLLPLSRLQLSARIWMNADFRWKAESLTSWPGARAPELAPPA